MIERVCEREKEKIMLNLIYFLYPIGLEFRLSQQEFNIFNILYIDWSFTHFDYFAFLLESIKITNNNNNKKEFVSIFLFYFIFYFVSFHIFVVVILLNKIQSETKISHLFFNKSQIIEYISTSSSTHNPIDSLSPNNTMQSSPGSAMAASSSSSALSPNSFLPAAVAGLPQALFLRASEKYQRTPK